MPLQSRGGVTHLHAARRALDVAHDRVHDLQADDKEEDDAGDVEAAGPLR